MDAYEATRVVVSRIQTLDPEHAAKIMGLLLLQDHGDKEMIRLALGPESLLHSLILKARQELGLSHLGPSSLSLKNSTGSRFPVGPPPPLTISSPSWAPSADLDEMVCWDPQLSSPEGSGFGWKPCLYFARGFCKNGSSCKFLHGLNEDKLDAAIEEQRRRLAVAGGFSYSPTGSLPMNHRAAAAALMLAGDESRFMGRSWSEFAETMNPASRQIYLTFPADSIFREEDVSNYFSIYGPVQDVRIPYQQKRMFGFVTFVYPETVKLILAKGNPHFVCDARVLVKPYKEKGKVPDKYRKQQGGDFSGCTTPTGLDSRDPFDFGARIMYNNANNNQEMLLRRKLEQAHQAFELQQAIEMQERRFMGLQLLDFKNRSPTISNSTTITTLPSNDRNSGESPTEDKNPSFVSSGGGQRQQLKAVNAADDKEESGSPSEDSDFEESVEHNLPDSPFASPTKASSIFAEDPFPAASAFSSVSAHSNGNGNGNASNLVPSTLEMASFKSCFFQTPRLSSGQEAVGL